MNFSRKNILLWLMGISILLPVFFQLNGGIYRGLGVLIDSQGNVAKLPLPLSILACLFVVGVLRGNLSRAIPALVMIAGVLVISLISILLGGDGVTPQQRKLLVMAQVLLPLGGLLLGALIHDGNKVIARSFLVVLSIVIPMQLAATWLQGGLILTHYLYAFSIYAHLQYVALILVCAYIFCLATLWDQQKIWLCVVGLFVSIYAVSSLSFLTIFAFFAFVFAFIACKFWSYRSSPRLIAVASILIVFALLGSYTYFKKMEGQRSSVEGLQPLYYGKFKELLDGKIPANVYERFGDWALFGRGIVESRQTFLVGHAQPMPREIRSSPHNYYIDIAYTFGVLALMPLLGLMGYTAYLCWRQRKSLPAETWWLLAIVFYLVVIDSSFKVTLRQPYPGIFTFFLWGILLSRLRFPGLPMLKT
jgi:hypothetical protein